MLAGGRARRFGGIDKTRLLVSGRPIIVRQVEILQRLTSRVYVVANDHRRFADLGVPVYVDRIRDAGALGGIHSALAVADAERVLVVGGDQPFLSADLLRHLASRANDGDGAWIHTSRGVEPLVACYRHHAIRQVRLALEAGDLKAADLSRRLEMVSVGASELASFGEIERLLTNINTPDDYSRLE